jgi:hypothetical protein
MANDSKSLTKAKTGKNDEFYTMLSDIEAEVAFYPDFFKDKKVYCNCDDPSMSMFWKFFSDNFEKLGLKQLVSTFYMKEPEHDLFSTSHFQKPPKVPVVSTYNGNPEGHALTLTYRENLKGNGDFASEECRKYLEDADVVVTNPPFSLFRDFMKLMLEMGKKFLIVGNVNAITNKAIFKAFKEGKMWFGPSIHSGDREFKVPESYPLQASGFRVDEKGNKFIRVKGVRWFTNILSEHTFKKLELTTEYSDEDYWPAYDEDPLIIDVSETKKIPKNYTGGIMGVPITFMDKYHPDQFEILGLDRLEESRWGKVQKLDGKELYHRILVRAK